jgi:tetratricopeptide (TPR) repeat protein
MESYRDSRPEDYYSLLDINAIPNEQDVVGMYPAIDTAIAKCKKVIQKHSMPSNDRPHLKKEEHNRWIDENWTTIGIASYLRRDYEGAMKSFKYVRKFYKNDPSLYIGELWMAKTNIANGKLPEAKFNLENLDKALQAEENPDPKKKSKLKSKKKDEEPAKFPKKIRADFERTKAELALIKDNKKDAIKYLEESLKHKQDNKQKARTHFVLGQLYEEQKDDANAVKHYTKVIKGNAKYEMVLNAKIKKAFLGNTQDQKKDLFKMIKDAKNAEYRDQIYFALAGIELKENKEQKASEHLTLSAFYSNKNKRQKGMAYEKLGDLKFAKRDYVRAQKYYDSCANVIPETYPNAEAIRNKAANLANLVVAVETAMFEDSVQRIAAMPETQRQDFLEDLIKKIKEEEQKRKEREAIRLRELQENQTTFNDGAVGSKFYWNNEKMMRDGKQEFKRLWGERLDEDDWRRSEKLPTNIITDGGEDNDSIVAQKEDTLSVEMLEANLPLSEEKLKTSNERLLEAYYNAGVIYNKELNEEKTASEYFEKVIDKPIEDKHKLLSAFELYKMYETKNASRSAGYRQYILDNYPKSDFAFYLQDPDYFIKKKEMDALAEQEYITVLERYNRGIYYPVISKSDKVIVNEPENIFRPKYMLLKALAKGQVTEDKKELIPILETIILEYPESLEAERAKEMINIVNNGYSVNEEYDFDKKSTFNYDNKAKLKVIVMLDKETNSNSAKVRIVDFNREFFSRKRINVASSAYSSDQSMVILSDFENESAASEYIRVYKQTRKHLLNLQNATIMMVTDENLKVVIQQQKLKEYETFYEEYY